jgi:muconate cycloisomerase
MRITSIEIIKTKIPLKHPYKLSQRYGDVLYTHPIIVKINTDEGLTGYGETDPWKGFTQETPDSAATVLEKDITPLLIGLDPSNVLKLHEVMDFFIPGNQIAKSAVDMAAYDLLGKAAGMPVYRVLGGNLYESLPIMGAIGTAGDPSVAVKEVMAQKYHAIMIKVGRDPIADAEFVLAVRDAAGTDFPLILDANQGWDIQSARKFISIVYSANPVLFEQPLKADDLEGMAALRRFTDIPISVDESLTSFNTAKEIIRLGAADIFSIKVCKNGGIRESLRIVELAKNHGINILFNSMLEEGITQAASLNVALTTSNLFDYGHAYFSPLRLEADITNYSDLIYDGQIHATTAPGLGIEIFDDVLDRYTTGRFMVSKGENIK